MSFSADISKFVDRANGNIDQATRMATVMLAQGVVLKSPVDTGRFRGNWLFGSEVIPRSTTDELDASGQKTLSLLISQIGQSEAGGITYLSNNLPYAIRLENGWSKQAPQGMARLTAVEFQDYVTAAAKEVNP